MIYVPMTGNDLEAVAALEQSIQQFPWTSGHFRDSLNAGHECWLQHDSHGLGLLAFSVTMSVIDEIHLLDIGVAKSGQRTGIGTRLLDFLCTRAREQQMVRMLLEVRTSNLAAIKFYRHFEFVEIGRRRGYYPALEGREDALVMAKEL